MLERLPITEARYKLTGLSKKFKQKPESDAIAVTHRGKPVLAIMPWEFYETIVETLDIMSDEKLMKALRQSIKELREGKTTPWEKVKKGLNL